MLYKLTYKDKDKKLVTEIIEAELDVCIKTLLFTIVIILLQEYSLLQMLFI